MCSFAKLALLSKINCLQDHSVTWKMCSMDLFEFDIIKVSKNNQKSWHNLQKKTAFCSNLKNWVFLCWLKCHLTPISLIAPKQHWCHFEALECIFHFNKENFLSFHQLTHNQQNSAFPNLWLTLKYILKCLSIYNPVKSKKSPLIQCLNIILYWPFSHSNEWFKVWPMNNADWECRLL